MRAAFFDYGQPARKSEWEAAKAIAEHYGIELVRHRLGLKLAIREGEYLGRNALLVLGAASTQADGPLVVATGLHGSSPYYDSSKAFLGDMQRLLDGYFGGSVTVSAPFIETDKAGVVKFAKRHKLPLNLTYSCERKNAPACGECPSCKDRIALDVD